MRIDNGYRLRLRPMTTVSRVHALIDDFKRRARPILEDTLYRQAAQLAVKVIDQRILGLLPQLSGLEYTDDESPIAVAYRVMLDQHRQTDHNDCHVVLLPAAGDVLIILRTDQAAVVSAWEATEGVQPFFYWDDAERPPDVSVEEWAVRAGLWTSALGQGWGTTVAGYLTECFGRYGLPVPLPADLLERLPTRAERAQVFAVDRATQHYIRRQAPKSAVAQKLAIHDGLVWTHQEQAGHAMVEIERETVIQLLPEINEALLAG